MPGDDHEAAARQAQNGCRNVDVVQLADPGRVEAGAVCVDLGDLFAADEADRVEVVNVEIAEDAAGRGDVLRGRRNGIVRRGTHHQDLSDAARRNGVARRSVARRRSAAGNRPERRCRRGRPLPRTRSRVARSSATGFSQNAATADAAANWRSGAWLGVDVAITSASTPASSSSSGVATASDSELCRNLPGALSVGVGYRYRDTLEAEESLDVMGADPAQPDDADFELLTQGLRRRARRS